MASASWALQVGLHQALVSSAALTALLGGAHIYDHVPRGKAFPYVTFGVTTERDWSTGTDDGGEHILTLHVWSNAPGRDEASRIIDTLTAALHDQAIALSGHRLVNLRHEFTDTRRQPDNEIHHGVVRFRAVTEPAP